MADVRQSKYQKGKIVAPKRHKDHSREERENVLTQEQVIELRQEIIKKKKDHFHALLEREAQEKAELENNKRKVVDSDKTVEIKKPW